MTAMGEPYVNTVLGSIHADQIGVAAMHEHVQFGVAGWEYGPEEWFDRLWVFEKTSYDLRDFREAGGFTLVDCSGIGLGRDVYLFALLSRSTGVHIVCSTGYWAERGIHPYFARRDIDFQEELFVRELTEGMLDRDVDATSSKAGIIKLANSLDTMTPLEEITFRAGARAARRTGCAVTTHGPLQARRQLEVLREEGLDADRIIIGHLDDVTAIDFERDKEIARSGAYVGYDHIGTEDIWSPAFYATTDHRRADLVAAMVEAGYKDRLILSCDTNAFRLGGPTAPKHRYAHLIRAFVPMLRQRGVSAEAVHDILVENPKRVLPFQ